MIHNIEENNQKEKSWEDDSHPKIQNMLVVWCPDKGSLWCELTTEWLFMIVHYICQENQIQ